MRSSTLRVRTVATVVALTVLTSACGTGATPDSGSPDDAGGFSALPANFDLAVDSPQAFLVALAGPDRRAVAYGTAEVSLSYLGPVGRPLDRPRAWPARTAAFRPAAGASPGTAHSTPRLLRVSETVGVYATNPLRFTDAGYWQATVTVVVDGRSHRVTAAFEVLDRHRVPAVGERAPATPNPVIGAPGIPAQAIDSRATSDASIPDADLHRTSIAGALAAHRPLVIVISTPAFCESRLCGPVTDAVAAVAARYSEGMDFVHLEVFADGQSRRLNPAAAEWIRRNGADANEPWVFVVNADGVITHRFDNVVNEAQIDAAVRDTLG